MKKVFQWINFTFLFILISIVICIFLMDIIKNNELKIKINYYDIVKEYEINDLSMKSRKIAEDIGNAWDIIGNNEKTKELLSRIKFGHDLTEVIVYDGKNFINGNAEEYLTKINECISRYREINGFAVNQHNTIVDIYPIKYAENITGAVIIKRNFIDSKMKIRKFASAMKEIFLFINKNGTIGYFFPNSGEIIIEKTQDKGSNKNFTISSDRKKISINGKKYNLYTKEEYNINGDKFGFVGVGEEDDDILTRVIIKIVIFLVIVNFPFLCLYIAKKLFIRKEIKEDSNHTQGSEPILIKEKITVSNETIDKIAVEYDLTTKEKAILYSLVEGCSNREISDKFFIAIGTTKNHVYNIFKKCNVSSREEIYKLYNHYINLGLEFSK